jgi:formylglycine-generating enzyme required for sulfatase activity
VSKGSAILAVGHGLADATPALTSLVAQIGEALLAIGWAVRRLSPVAGERDGADRASWKRCVTEICETDADVIVLAFAGRVVALNDEPCLVTGDDVARFPEDATLPLEWIRDRLRTCRADRVVVVASLEGPSDDAWLDALATGRARHVVVTERRGGPALGALLDGLRGTAIDPKTGTITLRSLGDHLAHHAPKARLQVSDESETLASSPPLAGPWDARLTSRPTRTIAVEEALVGTVLPGRFEIKSELARGSFGNVYLARQLAVDRDVAVKVLHGVVAPGSETGRLFVHEIQSVGRLDHPNVVRIYQADITAAGSLFYAMELLAGRDLQQVIEADGKMEKPRAIALVRQLASALGAAHEVGLVHADVKPANAIVVAGKSERLVLVDFGLARLRAIEPVASAGGTPAYMAPEQLRDGRVDARSDVFSAALVLVTLLTGWRRRAADQLVPPLDAIDDAALRDVLAKALSLAPADRYQHGGELATALGEATRTPLPTSPPFRHLAPFTEADRDRLYGRDREIETLVEHVLFRRAVIYTAPTGAGKTSLLRAGLVPRLDALGVATVYVACHGREPPDLARAIWPEGATAVAAATARIASEHKRLVIVVDQVEAALANRDFARELQLLERAAEPLLGVVMSVREDVLASLLAQLGAQTDVLRLGPLASEGAREAIAGPLLERRVTIEEPLLAALIGDLERAASLIASEMRWPAERAVYPPHLQLACSALFDQLDPGEDVLALRHYEQLGGLDEIVSDYLDRVLETELPGGLVATARRVLLALVDTDRSRAVRSDAELAEHVPASELAPVLDVLRARGIVVPLRAANGQPAWELVHDSLVPRVLAWSDRQDLARQRALEIVRHHLRGSDRARPSLLTADELREVRPHAAAIDELDREWGRRGPAMWTPVQLVAESRRVRRMRIAGFGFAIAIAIGTASFLGVRWFAEREQRQRQELQSKADLGTFVLELHAFDWDPKRQVVIPVSISELPQLQWRLFDPATDDELAPGKVSPSVDSEELTTGKSLTRRWTIEARGGKAVLVISGRGRNGATCSPSIVPLTGLPGYVSRDTSPTVSVAVPTCEATFRDTIAIPAGPFISGGPGDPAAPLADLFTVAEIPPERNTTTGAYALDRTEVSNAAYRAIATTSMIAIATPTYPNTRSFEHANDDHYPVAGVSWAHARAYCRYFGKDLPTDEEWEKASRGGLEVDGVANPAPRRTLPWGTLDTMPANILTTGPLDHYSVTGTEHSNPIEANPGDVGPYGVLDLVGNVYEWTRTLTAANFAATRGGSWGFGTSETIRAIMLVGNPRPITYVAFDLGFRCAVETPSRGSD